MWSAINKELRDRFKDTRKIDERDIENVCMIIIAMSTAGKISSDVQN